MIRPVARRLVTLALLAAATPAASAQIGGGSIGRPPPADSTQPSDFQIATWFDRGDTDRALRAIKQATGQPADAPLAPAAIAMLLEIASVDLGHDCPPIAIYRLAYDAMTRPGYKDVGGLLGRRGLIAISVSTVRLMLATALLDEGYAAEAEPHLRALADPHMQDEAISTLGWTPVFQLGLALEALARPEEAELLYRRLLAGCAAGPCDRMFADPLDRALVRVLIARGRAQAAVDYAAQLAERPIADDLNDFRLIDRLLLLARALVAAGDSARAEATLRRAIALAPAPLTRIEPDWAYPGENARRQLADLFETTGRAEAAEPIRRQQRDAIAASPRTPVDGSAPRTATLALAHNLVLQRKNEAFALYGTLWSRTVASYGPATPQSLDVAEPFARALLRAGRAGDALPPARAALAARTSGRFLGDAANVTQSDRDRARKRAEAARLMVEAAWQASR
ncbi:hypothetical protein [Sphingomonas sp.]|uniref:hypothetical protein n=1 Tax=Sphingomonas sp. TaxID=28214 RepID=UPI001EC227B0|nr:hypothetical protein [Sphingomonas sp.]MBX3594166.1 hypothetical protein [Sphingomonas sp.]